MNYSLPCSSKIGESSGSLKSVATGLFIDWDKRHILIKAVEDSLRNRFNTWVECGPPLPSNLCQLTLRALDTSPSTSLAPPRRSNPVNFAGSKELLDMYLTMIKESRPNFVLEKKTETIDLDSSDDESYIFVDNSISSGSKPDVLTNNVKSKVTINDKKEPLCVGKKDVDIIVVDLENETADILLSDDKCKVVKSAESMKNHDTTAKKHDSFSNMTSDKKLAEVILDMSDDVIIVESCEEELQINDKNKGTTNLIVTAMGEERTVTLTPRTATASVKVNRNRKRKRKSTLNKGSSQSKKMRLTPHESLSTNDSKENPRKTKLQQGLRQTFAFARSAGKVVTKTSENAVEGSKSSQFHADVGGNQPKQGTEKVNNSSAADASSSCSSKRKRKGLLSYKPVAHLSQSTARGGGTAVASARPSNIYNPVAPVLTGLRPIAIDGNNVANGHGQGQFSLKGLQICVNYFEKRGHRDIKAFLPRCRQNQKNFDDLRQMEERGVLVFTPSHRVEKKMVVPYDDRYVVQYAHAVGAVIVSNDNYRDLIQENPEWIETIEKRLLMFTWVNDMLMFPKDPLGKNGPSLDQYLKFPH